MLPQKQLCLARNRLGMLCQCQALSSGRCRFHGSLSVGTVKTAPRQGSSGFVSSFGAWRHVFAAPSHAPAGPLLA